MLLSTMLMARTKVEKKENPQMMKHKLEAKGQHEHQMMCDELKLTPEQKAKFENLRMEHQKNRNTLQADIKNIRIDIQAAIKVENFKRAKDLNKQLSAKKTQLADARIDHMEAMMKELTTEQKVIAREILPRMGMNEGRKGGMNQGKMGQGMKHCK
jgi:Spy/CpxP family protein refolding chaperone